VGERERESCDLWERERESCDLWERERERERERDRERERVVICRIDGAMSRTSIETVIAKYLLCIVQHVSALTVGHIMHA